MPALEPAHGADSPTPAAAKSANPQDASGQSNPTGMRDGTGSAAHFSSPAGLAVDGAGNIYLADWGGRTIRKIAPGGVVTTLAGWSGKQGANDGTGSEARFNSPGGLALDGSGNIYVADFGNQTIRKVTLGGLVTTLAGSAGLKGSSDGAGSAARFNSPSGVAVDTGGNLYVADYENQTIRKITPAGVVTTLAGHAGKAGGSDGAGSAAHFSSPGAVAVDGSGNLYVADFRGPTIRKITPDGVVTTLAGKAGALGQSDGAGSAARFNHPSGVALDGAGNVYVADWGNDTIRKITPDGVVTTLAGSAGNPGSIDATGSAARLNNPGDVALDASGNIYDTDWRNNTVRKITPDGVVTTLAGNPPPPKPTPSPIASPIQPH